jgi:beta-fructofuranosidase
VSGPGPVRRPQLHFTPVRGWVNDPLALIRHDGRYHLFFQYVPERTVWSPDCRWGHATSEDLLHWTSQPVALSPDGDEDGCWSGNLVHTDAGEAVIFYTAVASPDVEIGWVRPARPLDGSWRSWAQGGEVVRHPAGESVVAFRDPFVFRDGECWRMLVGGGDADGHAVAWAFSSTDLDTWSYDGRAAQRSVRERDGSDGGAWTGSVWECPVLVDLGDRHALVVSAWEPDRPHYVAYAFCTLDGGRLVTGPWRRLGYGPCYYASSTYVDAAGRPGLIHWLREVGDVDAGWAGAHSVPHLLVVEGECLVAVPHDNVDRLRGEPSPVRDDRIRLPAVADVEWDPDGSGVLRVTTTVGAEIVHVAVDGDELTARAGAHEVAMPWDGGPVRLLLDGPVAELFTRAGVLALPLSGVEAAMHLQATDLAQVTAYPLGQARPDSV